MTGRRSTVPTGRGHVRPIGTREFSPVIYGRVFVFGFSWIICGGARPLTLTGNIAHVTLTGNIAHVTLTGNVFIIGFFGIMFKGKFFGQRNYSQMMDENMPRLNRIEGHLERMAVSTEQIATELKTLVYRLPDRES